MQCKDKRLRIETFQLQFMEKALSLLFPCIKYGNLLKEQIKGLANGCPIQPHAQTLYFGK